MRHHNESDKIVMSPGERQELDKIVFSLLNDPVPPGKAEPSRSYGGYGYVGGEEDEVHLRDYWRAVRKRLWLIIGIVALATALTSFYEARKPNVYQAQARVQVDVDNSGPSLSANAKNSPVVLNSGANYPAYFNTQLKILSGPGLLRRVAKTLDLEHNPGFLENKPGQAGVLWQSLAAKAGLGGKAGEAETPVEEVPLADSVTRADAKIDIAEATRLAPYVECLQEGLSVEPVKEDDLSTKETFLIDVKFNHADRQLAAKVVNTIGDIFVLSNLEKKTQVSSATSDYMQKRIVELQSQIRSREEELGNYAKGHEILSLDSSQNTVVDRLVGLNKQLLEAENERKMAEAAYKSAQSPGAAAALAQSAASDTGKEIAEAEGKLVELRQRRAQLLVDYTEKFPEVKEIDHQIEILEKQIADTRSQATSVVLTNLETRYRQAAAREDALRTAFEQQRGETLTQNQAAINYKIIQQEIDTNKELLSGLLQRAKENDVVAAGTPNNISVSDYATVPVKPAGPRRLVGVAVALLLSLCAGVGFALFLDYMDDTITSAEQVETRLQLPALAAIPVMGGFGRRRLLGGRQGGALHLRGGDGGEALIIKDARSPQAEAYRQLRTQILLSTPGRAPKSLLVTSSVPSEGKTTTSVNTAICFAQMGGDVLIIDADMRRPRLHSIFGIANGHGLSTILSSERSIAEEAFSAIRRDAATGLYVMPSGTVPPNPAELLGSEQMRSLISLLEHSFKYIIIDSPPVGSFTDAVLISTLVSGVLLVVHASRSSQGVIRRTQRMLQEIGGRIFGVVLNSADLKEGDSYYNYKYT